MTWIPRRLVFLAGGFGLTLSPQFAWGHSTQIYVSTPFSPPVQYVWVPVLFLLAHFVWFRYVSTKFPEASWKVFLGFFVLANACPWIVGVFATTLTSAPPPGLGLPHPAFTGYGWADVGSVFAFFNILGILAHLVVFFVFVRSHTPFSRRWRFFYLGGVLVLYIVFLAPYALGRALTHGWHGSYVSSHCRENLDLMSKAMAYYLATHDGMLPEAEDAEELSHRIFTDEFHENMVDSPYPLGEFICPIERSFEKEPKPYEWNRELSSAKVKELREMDQGTLALKCYRSHYGGYYSVSLEDVLAEYEAMNTATEESEKY